MPLPVSAQPAQLWVLGMTRFFLNGDFVELCHKTAYPGKEKANLMRNVREELERLREKLRRVELRTARDSGFAAPAQPRSGALPGTEPAHELPPWESAPDDSAFESTLELSPRQHSALGIVRAGARLRCSGSVVRNAVRHAFETDPLPRFCPPRHFGGELEPLLVISSPACAPAARWNGAGLGLSGYGNHRAPVARAPSRFSSAWATSRLTVFS